MKSSRIVVGLVGVLFVLTVSPLIALADAVTLTFQEGDGGAYSNTHGADVDLYNKTGLGTGEMLWIGGDAVDHYSYALLWFSDFIGPNAGQVPPGATIESASLHLKHYFISEHAAVLKRIDAMWDEDTVSGAAAPAASGTLGYFPAGAAGTVEIIDVKDLVQAWVAGTATHWGFEFRQGSTVNDITFMSFYSDDAPTVADRPLLSVTFTPNLTATEATTWGKVKALYR